MIIWKSSNIALNEKSGLPMERVWLHGIQKHGEEKVGQHHTSLELLVVPIFRLQSMIYRNKNNSSAVMKRNEAVTMSQQKETFEQEICAPCWELQNQLCNTWCRGDIQLSSAYKENCI